MGYPIADLANLDPEAAIYLLYNKSPSDARLTSSRRTREQSSVDTAVIDVLKALPWTDTLLSG